MSVLWTDSDVPVTTKSNAKLQTIVRIGGTVYSAELVLGFGGLKADIQRGGMRRRSNRGWLWSPKTGAMGHAGTITQ